MPRVRGEADWMVVPQIILIAPLEASSDNPSSPEELSPIAITFQRLPKWPYNDICQIPQHSWMHPIRARGFLGIQFA